MKSKLKNLKVAFIGKDDWKKVRALMVLKFIECRTEEQFSCIIEGLIGSMFRNAKEMDTARKKIGKKLLTKIQKRNIEKKLKEASDKKGKERKNV